MNEKMIESEIHVGMGDARLGHPPVLLKAILGSCVGIGFLVPTLKAYALAHCLLPMSRNEKEALSPKYVDGAIRTLFQLLDLGKHDAPLIQAVVAGGANMHGEQKRKILRIGEMNVEAALKVLDAYKVKIIHQDTGLFYGRQLIINCQDGSFSIRNLIQNEPTARN